MMIRSLFLLLLMIFTFTIIIAQDNQNCNYPMGEDPNKEANNVYGEPLQLCCIDPLTGFYRNGQCTTSAEDYGTHIVCAIVNDEFLEYSKSKGNDLITPRPEYNFPGLKAGDGWCLCISRWLEAVKAGVAPPINISATHEKALQYTTIELLELYDVARQN